MEIEYRNKYLKYKKKYIQHKNMAGGAKEYTWTTVETSNIKNYEKQIFEMYKSSYEKIGLVNLNQHGSWHEYYQCSFYLLKEEHGDEIVGIILYWKHPHCNKISFVISKNNDIAKQYVIPKLIELIKIPGNCVELSGPLETIVRRELTNIKDKKTIMKIISLKENDIFDENDKRLIEFPRHIKIIKNKPSTFEMLRDKIRLVKDKEIIDRLKEQLKEHKFLAEYKYTELFEDNAEPNIYPFDLEIIPSESGSYRRKIGDNWHTKSLFGIICEKFINENCDRVCEPKNE